VTIITFRHQSFGLVLEEYRNAKNGRAHCASVCGSEWKRRGATEAKAQVLQSQVSDTSRYVESGSSVALKTLQRMSWSLLGQFDEMLFEFAVEIAEQGPLSPARTSMQPEQHGRASISATHQQVHLRAVQG
jgi:hypothetical protein